MLKYFILVLLTMLYIQANASLNLYASQQEETPKECFYFSHGGKAIYDYICEYKNVLIPNGVTSLSPTAFYGANLLSVQLSIGLENIERYAFLDNNLRI